MRKLVAVLVFAFLFLAASAWADNALTVVSGTKASSGNNTLISAPAAGNCIVIHKVQIQNESSTSTVIKLLAGSTQIYQAELKAEGSGVIIDCDKSDPDQPKWKLPPATALVLNLSGANSHNYTVWYSLERMR